MLISIYLDALMTLKSVKISFDFDQLRKTETKLEKKLFSA